MNATRIPIRIPTTHPKIIPPIIRNEELDSLLF